MKLFRFTLPALVAMLGCSLLVGPPAFGQAAAAEGLKVQASKKAGSVVIPVFNLSGPFTEKPVADDNPFAFGAAEGQSLYSMMETLRQVKDDDAVPAIVLVVNSPSIGRAQLEELSRCFDELKAAGKKFTFILTPSVWASTHWSAMRLKLAWCPPATCSSPVSTANRCS